MTRMISAITRQHNDSILFQLCLNATIQDAGQLSEYIGHLLSDDVLTLQQRIRITLCIAEAVNNIVEHGQYSGLHRPIRCVLKRDSTAISVLLIDLAQAYTPPSNTSFNIFEENGRGWCILKKLSDKIEYLRIDDTNQLSLLFKLPNN